jgi:hypothetical protein
MVARLNERFVFRLTRTSEFSKAGFRSTLFTSLADCLWIQSGKRLSDSSRRKQTLGSAVAAYLESSVDRDVGTR